MKNIHNQFIRKCSNSKINDMLRFVFPGYGQSMVTERDDETSVFQVLFFDTEHSLTLTLDDYECCAEVSFYDRGYIHCVDNRYMGGVEKIRFYAWMQHQFGAEYMDGLARFLQDTYAEDR